jgi:hypothetical protein
MQLAMRGKPVKFRAGGRGKFLRGTFSIKPLQPDGRKESAKKEGVSVVGKK